MLTDSEKKKHFPATRKRKTYKKGGAPTYYSDTQKIEAVQMYVLTGDLPLVAKTLGILPRSLQMWKHTEWWKELEKELRQQENMILTAHLKRQVDKAMQVVQDRLENGDYIYDNKTGQMIRKPVPLKDAHKVVTDFIDRRHKLITVEEHKANEDSVKKRLADLAKNFEEFALSAKTKPPVQVTDVIFTSEVTSNVVSSSSNLDNKYDPGTLHSTDQGRETLSSGDGEIRQDNFDTSNDNRVQ